VKWLLVLFGISIAEGIWRVFMAWKAGEAAYYEELEKIRQWHLSQPAQFDSDDYE